MSENRDLEDVSEKIIREVRARKCLWDMRTHEYSNKQAKINAWREISVKLDLPGKCFKIWHFIIWKSSLWFFFNFMKHVFVLFSCLHNLKYTFEFM